MAKGKYHRVKRSSKRRSSMRGGSCNYTDGASFAQGVYGGIGQQTADPSTGAIHMNPNGVSGGGLLQSTENAILGTVGRSTRDVSNILRRGRKGLSRTFRRGKKTLSRTIKNGSRKLSTPFRRF